MRSTFRSPLPATERSSSRWSARFAITTEDGGTVLLLTDDRVAMQLSDRTLHKVKHKLRDQENDDDDGALGHAIKVAVLLLFFHYGLGARRSTIPE